MRSTLKNKLKIIKLLEHNDPYVKSIASYLYTEFKNGKLSDKEILIKDSIKAKKIEDNYKNKLNLLQKKLDHFMSPEERHKHGYMKHLYKCEQEDIEECIRLMDYFSKNGELRKYFESINGKFWKVEFTLDKYRKKTWLFYKIVI